MYLSRIKSENTHQRSVQNLISKNITIKIQNCTLIFSGFFFFCKKMDLYSLLDSR